jgi:hypothetical protein
MELEPIVACIRQSAVGSASFLGGFSNEKSAGADRCRKPWITGNPKLNHDESGWPEVLFWEVAN